MSEPISVRALLIRKAASAAAYGETIEHPEPGQPTEQEEAYLQAIELFRAGRQCAGWDAFERGDAYIAEGPACTSPCEPGLAAPCLPECKWTAFPECSICRGFHGREITHACE